jgi:hypothetical protein
VISRPSSHVLGVGHIAMEAERIPAQAPPFLLPLFLRFAAVVVDSYVTTSLCEL